MVTIIVLLILAGVTLSLVAGSDGILGKASNAVDRNNEAQIAEEVELAMAGVLNDYYTARYVEPKTTNGTYAEYAKAKLESEDGVETSKGKLTLSGTTVTYTPNDASGKTLTGTFNATTGVVKIGGATTGGSDPTPEEPEEPQEPETPNEPETPSIPEGLEIGADVTYTPSGTYADWTTDHSGGSSYNYSLASGAEYDSTDTALTDMTISNWKVFKINESTGEVQLVPDGTKVTTQTLGLYGATGYNNAVKLLNEACSSLYGNSSKGITARSINMEDIESVLNYDPETEYTNTSVNVKYGKQYSSEYTSNKKYPKIYAEEKESVITPAPEGKAKTLGINDAGSDWISGYDTAGTSIQPHQTFYKLEYSDFSSKLKTAQNGATYSSLLLPKTSSTEYWVASRCVSLGSSGCYFYVRFVNSGYLGAKPVFNSDGSALNGNARPLFPVVSLAASLLEGDATTGFSVK